MHTRWVLYDNNLIISSSFNCNLLKLTYIYYITLISRISRVFPSNLIISPSFNYILCYPYRTVTNPSITWSVLTNHKIVASISGVHPMLNTQYVLYRQEIKTGEKVFTCHLWKWCWIFFTYIYNVVRCICYWLFIAKFDTIFKVVLLTAETPWIAFTLDVTYSVFSEKPTWW